MRPSLSRALVLAPPLAPETAAYRARVALSAEALDRVRARVVDRWALRPMRGQGLTMRRLNLAVGVTLAQSLVPQIIASGGALDLNSGITYSEAAGWEGNGASHIDTTYSPSEATGGLGVYLRTTQASNLTARIPIGCRNAGSTQIFRIGGNLSDLGATSGAVLSMWGSNIVTPGDCPQTTGGLVAGFWQGVRTAGNAARLFKNGVSVGTSTASKTPATAGASLYLFAQNVAGSAASHLEAGSRIAGYGIDTGMEIAQGAANQQIWQNFQTAMNRAV